MMTASNAGRALPQPGEARIQEVASRSPSTPHLKILAKAPTRRRARGSFLAFGSPRGGVPRLSAANEKEKIRGKIETSSRAAGGCHE